MHASIVNFLNQTQDSSTHFLMNKNKQSFYFIVIILVNQVSIMLFRLRKLPLLTIHQKYIVANFGMLTDRMAQKQQKKAQEDFKKQISHMANKPSFTLMDYKQRIIDQLSNLKSSFKKKLSKEAQEAQKNLQMQKKVVNCLFEDQLVGNKHVVYEVRKQIALITGLQIDKVNQVFKKALSYKKMHKYLRNLNQLGQPLPQTMQQLQTKFRTSRFAFNRKQRRHARYRNENKRCKGSLRAMRIRYLKFNKQ